MKNEIRCMENNIEITIKHFDKGYLVTINYLDKDGDVEFGASGDFCENEKRAVLTAIDNYYSTFSDALILSPFFLSDIFYLCFSDSDNDYTEWCLNNNWLKGDESTAKYVCGESFLDDLYVNWVEETLGLDKYGHWIDDGVRIRYVKK